MTEAELHYLLLQRVEPTRQFVHRRIPLRMRRVISADDIVQESWISAFRSLPGFVGDLPSNFERWYMTIIQSKLIDAIRSANRAIRSADRIQEQPDRTGSYMNLLASIADNGRSASSKCAGMEAVQALRLAISALPENYREVITLHYIEGHSHAEIAAVLNKSEQAVNGLLYRSLLRLKERMSFVGAPNEHG